MKPFILFISIITLSNCKSISKNQYFKFDSVSHYTTTLTDKEVHEIKNITSKTSEQERFLKLYFDSYPKALPMEDIFAFGYESKEVMSYKLKTLNQLFRNRNIKKGYDYMCISKFRDILVFKKDGQIVGIAKICFSCKDNYIIGTEKNTFDFGLKGNYEKLEDLLYK